MSETEGNDESQIVTTVEASTKQTASEDKNPTKDDKIDEIEPSSYDETDKELPPKIIEEISRETEVDIKPEPRKRTVKKSVSFDPGTDDELAKKFTEGDVIVDKKNPFKNGTISGGSVEERIIVAKPRRSIRSKKEESDEFVTTEDVLRESKYVTTYIKNPDKVFKYDPGVIARIKLEELREIQGKKPQRKKTLTRQTQERLKELKSKYNWTPSESQVKQSKPSAESKIPKYRKVSKYNYPDLSEIKVKTGTDLDETFQCNPEEVVLNARRFDDRVKSLKIGSDDELDDIEETLSSIEYTEPAEERTTTDETDTALSVRPEESKKSFTNTVNSNEFREFLKKKGLILMTKEKPVNGNARIVRDEDEIRPSNLATIAENMDVKKVRKPSVLQRLLHPNLFSSKRKTTPKDPLPLPQSLYSNNSLVGNTRSSSSIKRVVLERQSFHGAPTTPSSLSTTSSVDMRKQIEQSRKSYGGDDRSSSISSALTNAEDFPDDYHSVESIRESDELPVRQSGKTRKAPNIPSKSSRPVPAVRTSVGRPVAAERKDIDENRNFRRSVSLDRQEIGRRTQIPVKAVTVQKPIRTGDVSHRSLSIPRSSRENYAPRMTSTPLPPDSKSATRPPAAVPVIKPVPLIPATASNLNVSTAEWNRLRELKERTDMELYKRTNAAAAGPNRAQLKLPPQEVIYETLPSARPRVQQPLNRTVEQIRSPIVAINPNFVRGTSHRNTYSGGGSAGFNEPETNRTMDESVVLFESRSPPPTTTRNLSPPERRYEAQPQRSQSVLDNMTTMSHQQLYGSIGSEPVTMRRKSPAVVLTKEEILNRVRDFCRRSMNRTPPTRMDRVAPSEAVKTTTTTAEISPVSYTSVNYPYRNGPQQIVAPQVPQRVHSLGQQSQTPCTSPIYAHVMKRGSIQSNVSDLYASPARGGGVPSGGSLNRPVARNLDSAMLHSAREFVIRNPPNPITERDARLHTSQEMQLSGRSGSEIYVGSGAGPYVQLPPPRPQMVARTRATVDGRSTPLILMDPQQSSRSPIYLNTVGAQPQQPPSSSSSSPATYFAARNQQSPQQRLPPDGGNGGGLHVRVVNEQMYRPPAVHGGGTKRFVQYSPQQRHLYESESGSEAGEVQRIMQTGDYEEDWQNDKSGKHQSNDQVSEDRRRANRREDPRRHTLGSDMLQYGGQGQPQQRAMDLEMGTRSQKSKKMPPIRGYTPINQGPLFDEDPGIMSEVETASTGFRRGGKQRSSLPVVRTPSKTLERPLGLVFLQYRSETKRALLPNEITSIDTVRALFVRSFPRQLTMAYLEGPNVKIYIHDASKDMFYELEDVRSHLREIRDRSVLRLFESNEVAAPQVLPGGPGVPQPLPQSGAGHWDQDQSYFSEPEFDSEYQHQHIHKSKGGKGAPYYVTATQTLPRGMYSDRNKNVIGAPAKPLRSYGSRGSMGPPFPYPPDQLYSIPDGYTSSPERGTRGGYEEPYYSQYGTRSSSVTPIIDEEQRCDGNLTDDQYSLYGLKVSGRIPRNPNQIYDPTRPEDLHRIRVEHMERQLANLTGLVQKALIQNPMVAAPSTINSNYLGIPGQCRGGLDDMDGHSSGSSTSIQDKSVSFEKSVSFSDDIQGVPKSHSPQHAADTKPPKPAIKSSTLPRTSSQERDRLKPPPPPKPIVLATAHQNYRPDIALAPEVYNHLRGLQKKAKDLRMEVRTLRRLSQAQAIAVREDIKDTFMRIRATLLASSGNYWGQGGDQERTRLSREEELYKQEVIRLEKDLSDLELAVEELRGEVINRRTRVNMTAVEDMALVLSRASKTVAELKMRFPGLQQGVRNILANEMEKVVREEKFLKDEPDRLESALRRCKKLTGTLVTLKRLASVQEQRLPVVEPVTEEPPRSADVSSANKPVPSPRLGTVTIGGGIAPENALDALLDELQTFAKPQSQIDMRTDESTSDDSSQILLNTVTTQHSQSNLYPGGSDPNTLQVNVTAPNNIIQSKNFTPGTAGNLRRLHSYPSGSDTDTSPPQLSRPIGKPPVPERNAELLSKVGGKRIPPPPPPRTSSRSPLASPTSPNVPAQRLSCVSESADQMGNGSGQDGSGNSSGNESGNDHVQRQVALEMRHQELLKKQKMLQEQYARLQQMSKNSIALAPADVLQLKKTGSESNLPQKMGLNLSATGSMKNLNADIINVCERNEKNISLSNNSTSTTTTEKSNGSGMGIGGVNNKTGTSVPGTTTNKVYETDIL